MQELVSVNPFRCRMWHLHDRIDNYVTEETCRAEIYSFSKHGQRVPVLGRPLAGDPDYEVELIYGARRLFVARHINAPLLVELRRMTDAEGFVAMDIENRQRLNISPYERGLSYARWIRAGYFKSQDELARALKISAPQVCRLLKMAQLPAVVVNAFESPADICEGWGLDLAKAIADCVRRQPTIDAARCIASRPERPPARDVYRQLLAASVRGKKVRASSRDLIVKDENGDPLFRIRHQSSSVLVILPIVSAAALSKISTEIVNVLGQPHASKSKSFSHAAGSYEQSRDSALP